MQFHLCNTKRNKTQNQSFAHLSDIVTAASLAAGLQDFEGADAHA